jgi:hypothetical protein
MRLLATYAATPPAETETMQKLLSALLDVSVETYGLKHLFSAIMGKIFS